MSKTFYIDPAEPDQGEFKLVPQGERELEVISTKEGQSSNGNYQVEVSLRDDETSATMRHWITFIPANNPGHGIGKHWLKTIDEPFEGEIIIEPENWTGKWIKAVVLHEQKNGKNYATLDISTIMKIGVEKQEKNTPF